MKVAEHLDRLAAEGTALADAAARAGLDAPVPTCPGWTVRELVRHVGNVHRWAATYVREGRPTPLDDAETEALFGPMPADDALLGWYRAGHEALVAQLRAAPEELDCWYFLRAPSPLAFWARRQAHETAIHRVDAESAGTASGAAGSAGAAGVAGVPADFAADGIDELLSCFYTRPRGRLRSDPPRTLAIIPTDAAAAWTFEIGPERNAVRAGAADDAHCRVGGPASGLYLALWNRRGFDDLDVRGDRSVLDLWRSLATIRWS